MSAAAFAAPSPSALLRAGGPPARARELAEHWPINGHAAFHADYGLDDGVLDRLYLKATQQQWRIDDYDWSHQFDPDNPLQMPDGTLLIFGTPLWQRMDDAERALTRRHFHAWTLSQVLHGEQGALLCATKLAQGEETLSARLCASAQVFDEARHIEVYQRMVTQQMGLGYAMSSGLRSLLQDTIGRQELDITNLGMQVLVEGIALSIFHNIVAYSRDPFVKAVVGRIQQDEARHFAVGRTTLRRLYHGELSEAEMLQREAFTCEGIHVLYEHLCADDIWQSLGHDRRACAALVRDSHVAAVLRRNLFRRLVPSLKDLGLLRGRVVSQLDAMGMLEYADLPLRMEV
jgi:hypothetical protein